MTHVLPVTDDGGSTAEVVRVLGGPAVGDIRSRCLRLAEEGDAEVGAAGRRRVASRPAVFDSCMLAVRSGMAMQLRRVLSIGRCHMLATETGRRKVDWTVHDRSLAATHSPLGHTLLPQSEAVRQLLGHRLSSTDPEAARQEWYRIVEGEHPLWQV